MAERNNISKVYTVFRPVTNRCGAFAVLAAALAMLSGCAGVVSLHPLVTESDKDAFFDPALLGSWREISPDDKPESANGQLYVVTRDGQTGYKVLTTDDGVEKTILFHLLKLPDRYLVDARDSLGDPALPVHVYFSLVLQKDSLKLSEMDTPWLKEQIAAREGLHSEVLTESDVSGKVVLTSPQPDLRKYFLPLAADGRSFANESEMRRAK
jgi:hypothetical protein